MNVLILTHADHEGPGAFGEVLSDSGAAVQTIAFHRDPAARPELAPADLILVMGGPMSVREDASHPWLAVETAFLAGAARDGRKILAVCLGAQILARALGADVRRAPGPEIGYGPIELTEEGAADPVLAGLRSPETVLHWHEETFELPREAVRLASSAVTPNQAFRWGRHAYALQFHLEVTPPQMDEWLAAPAMQESLTRAPNAPSPDALRAAAAEHQKRLTWLCSSTLTRLVNLL